MGPIRVPQASSELRRPAREAEATTDLLAEELETKGARVRLSRALRIRRREAP
jgi:hypothetical protein